MARDRMYVEELAGTVMEMFANGDTDPSALEIAEAHFPDKTLGGEIIEGVRKRLGRVRDVLEETYEQPVHLTSRTYYIRFRDNPPKTQANARRCLPVGHGVKQEGLRLQDGPDDLIWQAMLALNLAAGAGKVKKSVDRTADAVEDHRLSEEDARGILAEAGRRAQPRKPAIVQRVMEALPGGSSEE